MALTGAMSATHQWRRKGHFAVRARAVTFDFAFVLAFVAAGIGFGAVNLLLGSFIRPRFPTAEKDLPYECGEKPVGPAWFNFNPRFYVVALVFVVFEVEVALTLPVAMVLRSQVFAGLGVLALVELTTFIAVLAAGLVWVWAGRDLDWVKGAMRG